MIFLIAQPKPAFFMRFWLEKFILSAKAYVFYAVLAGRFLFVSQNVYF
jgi:hypothetical protein